MKRTIGNLAAAILDQLATAVKRSLKKIQYRPHLGDFREQSGMQRVRHAAARPSKAKRL
ncbi:hypothetical protein OG609_03235 [Streptomyces sp. NBC_01224]|nr:hypothetical protein OG609_03235 [Streptomyces sp. NBC_01224]